jgi:hypothetical protein
MNNLHVFQQLAFFHGGGKKGKISKMSELVRKDEA